MSIAAVSSSFTPIASATAGLAPVALAPTPRAVRPREQEGSHGHELVDAMNEVLGSDGEQSRDVAQAEFRFAHALMRELRSIDAGPTRGPSLGHAWGRRDCSDLPQRIDALATPVGAPTAASAPALANDVPATSPTPTQATTPDEPLPPTSPVTTTSVAVHLMQVPSSRLMEAFMALRRAMGDQSDAMTAGKVSSDLAAFLQNLSAQLAPDTPSALSAGSVVNLTA